MTGKYVHEDLVPSFLLLGWMFAKKALMYEDEFCVWLMIWPCECRAPIPKEDKKCLERSKTAVISMDAHSCRTPST